jgi:hypothetical protein
VHILIYPILLLYIPGMECIRTVFQRPVSLLQHAQLQLPTDNCESIHEQYSHNTLLLQFSSTDTPTTSSSFSPTPSTPSWLVRGTVHSQLHTMIRGCGCVKQEAGPTEAVSTLFHESWASSLEIPKYNSQGLSQHQVMPY